MDTVSDLLIKEGIVSADVLNGIRTRAKGRSFVVEIYNTLDVDEDRIVDIFADGLKIRRADLSDIMPDALGKFTKDHALKYMCMPFEKEGRKVKVAMLDPLDIGTLQEFSFITGLTPVPHVTSKSQLMAAMQRCFDMSTDLARVLDSVSSGAVAEVEFVQDHGDKRIEEAFMTGKREELDEQMLAPAIKLVNLFIREALDCRASDIHIEPGQKAVTVRFRIDGVLATHTQIPKWMHSAIASRVKIMSKLDISNRKTPQDGGMKLKVGNVQLDVRVSTLPTHLGEKVVMRLLKPGEKAIELPLSGLSGADLERLRTAMSRPQGMILMTGPTGSGKTTTLHGMLTELRSEGTNIVTVEDPVEYELEGITQVHVNEKAGLTFANALRSILRQDPDVVMVGEIRDIETADVAFRASNTGHLVLSTLHTNGTAATITRLYDIGVEPYLISSSLHCVVAQRLLRVICPHCAVKYAPDEDAFAALPGIDRKASFVRGKGCAKCNNTGYRGRLAVVEIMEITPSLRKLISGRASAGELRDASRKEGMRTLYEAALEHVYNGKTTIDEVLRAVTVDDTPGASCPNCGRMHAEADCPYCGTMPETSCRKCSSGLEEGWAFCPFCGSPREKEKAPGAEEKARVLIVDDEFGILKMVELALRPLDVEVHTAQNGREALEAARNINPGLIITDINMPVMDGYELIRELRSKVSTMFIPVVILSSRDSVEDKLKGFTFGTDDYITKPFDYTELQARVKRLMKRMGN